MVQTFFSAIIIFVSQCLYLYITGLHLLEGPYFWLCVPFESPLLNLSAIKYKTPASHQVKQNSPKIISSTKTLKKKVTFLSPPPAWWPPGLIVEVLADVVHSNFRLSIRTWYQNWSWKFWCLLYWCCWCCPTQLVYISDIHLTNIKETTGQSARTCPPPGLWLALARDPILQNQLSSDCRDHDDKNHDGDWRESKSLRERKHQHFCDIFNIIFSPGLRDGQVWWRSSPHDHPVHRHLPSSTSSKLSSWLSP